MLITVSLLLIIMNDSHEICGLGFRVDKILTAMRSAADDSLCSCRNSQKSGPKYIYYIKSLNTGLSRMYININIKIPLARGSRLCYCLWRKF